MNRPALARAVSVETSIASTRLVIADGTLEAMKWLALLLMTLDHVNKYLLDGRQAPLFALGRIAMPLFVFVLAYNLARPTALSSRAIRRTAIRLALYGALACIPFIALGKVYSGWWPLNILFTLLVATLVIGLMEQGGRLRSIAAFAVFIIGGGLVEYWWFALALAITCWRYCKQPSALRLVAIFGCIAALWPINQSPWAFAALPLTLLAPYVALTMRRRALLFYVYYPTHLGVLFVMSVYL